MKLKSLLINKKASLLDCLKRIDQNLHGFVLVVDEKNVLQGTMNDGDLRRLLITHKNINLPITGMYNKNYRFVQNDASFIDLARVFRETEVKYVPVVDEKHKICRVILKEQFYNAALKDQKFDFGSRSLGERVSGSDIHVRPWGFYKSTLITKYSQSKIIFVSPLQELSLQKHSKREEHWVVGKGNGLVTIGETVKKATAGNYFFIPKGCLHRLKNTSAKNNLIVLEVQLGAYFGEDDIVRYEDNYGRN